MKCPKRPARAAVVVRSFSSPRPPSSAWSPVPAPVPRTHTRVYLLQFDTAEVADRILGTYAGYDDASYDVLVVVVQSRKGTAAAVPFQQTIVLQSRLLG